MRETNENKCKEDQTDEGWKWQQSENKTTKDDDNTTQRHLKLYRVQKYYTDTEWPKRGVKTL